MTIFGLSGYAQSGKDTVAGMMGELGYEQIAFADVLREALIVLNPRVQYKEGAEYHDLADAWVWYGYEKLKANSPQLRGLLQRLGTDVGRDMLGQDVWVDATFRRMDPSKSYVIADVRFPNEARAIERAGGHLVRVQRPGCGPINDHISEVALDDYPFTLILENSGSLDDLQHLVYRFFK